MTEVTALALGLDSRPAAKGAQEFEQAVGKAIAAAVAADGRLRDVNGRFVALGAAEQQAAAGARQLANDQTALGGALGKSGGSAGNATLRFLALTTGIGSAGAILLKTIQHLKNFVNEADHLHDLSARFDLPVETLSILGEEAKLAGGSIDLIAKGLSKLAIAKQAALGDRKGTGDAAEAFGLLGINPTQFSKDAAGLQSLFEAVAAGIREVGDTAAKEDLAKKLLGKSGAELIPFIDEFDGFAGKAARHSTEAADAADKWNDAVERLGASMDRVISKAAPFAEAAAALFGSPPVLNAGENGPAKESPEERVLRTLRRVQELRKQLANTSALSLDQNSRFSFTGLSEELEIWTRELAAANKELENSQRLAAKPGRDAFLASLTAEAGAIGKTGLALRLYEIEHEVATKALRAHMGGLAEFNDALEATKRKLIENTVVAEAKTSVASLTEQIERFGRTAAEVRELDFNKITSQLGDIRSTEVARVRREFEALNATLQELEDRKVFEDQVRSLSQAARLARLGADEREREAAVLQLIEATQGRITQEQADQIRELVRARQETERLRDLGQEFADGLTSGLEESLIRLDDFRGVALSAFQDIERAALRAFLIQPLNNALAGLFGGGLTSLLGSARGNVFRPGQGGPEVVPFANGGVFSSPLMFPMAGGRRGIMAEAGKPEAIMPLERGPDGVLGVRSRGGGGGSSTVVNMQVYANDADSFRRSGRQIMGDLQKRMPRAA